MLSVQSNMAAMNASANLGKTSKRIAKSAEKLSSGYRVNRAADDAAGLTISETMRRQIRGLNQASDNIQDGISLCQVVDGALNEMHSLTQRINELTIKASNGTLTDDDRAAVQQEVHELLQEYNHIAITTTFNDISCLSPAQIKVPSPDGDRPKADIVFLVDTTGSMGSNIKNVSDNLARFASGLSDCDVQFGLVAYNDVTTSADPPLTQYPFTDDIDSIKSQFDALAGSVDGGGDLNESALEAIDLGLRYSFRSDATKQFILLTDAPFHDKNSDGLSAHTSSGIKAALNSQNVRLSLISNSSAAPAYKSAGLLTNNGLSLDIRSNFADGLSSLVDSIKNDAGSVFSPVMKDVIIQCGPRAGNTYPLHLQDMRTSALGLNGLSCLTQEDAQSSISVVSDALAKISACRSMVGTDQNILESMYDLNNNISENTQAAESLIRDTNMSKEMVHFSKDQILQQAGLSILSQANQSRNGILQLLQ